VAVVVAAMDTISCAYCVSEMPLVCEFGYHVRELVFQVTLDRRDSQEAREH